MVTSPLKVLDYIHGTARFGLLITLYIQDLLHVKWFYFAKPLFSHLSPVDKLCLTEGKGQTFSNDMEHPKVLYNLVHRLLQMKTDYAKFHNFLCLTFLEP